MIEEKARPSIQDRIESLKQQYQQFSQREEQAQAELLHARAQKFRVEGAIAILNELANEIWADDGEKEDATTTG